MFYFLPIWDVTFFFITKQVPYYEKSTFNVSYPRWVYSFPTVRKSRFRLAFWKCLVGTSGRTLIILSIFWVFFSFSRLIPYYATTASLHILPKSSIITRLSFQHSIFSDTESVVKKLQITHPTSRTRMRAGLQHSSGGDSRGVCSNGGMMIRRGKTKRLI
jgi:hypothetical protein